MTASVAGKVQSNRLFGAAPESTLTGAQALDAEGEDLGDLVEVVRTLVARSDPLHHASLAVGRSDIGIHTDYILGASPNCRAAIRGEGRALSVIRLSQNAHILRVDGKAFGGTTALRECAHGGLALMAGFRLTRIATPGLLASIEPRRLFRFLAPMQQWLTEKGVNWPDPEFVVFNYDKLAEILHFPLEPPPETMIESLLLVDEMCDDGRMDRILEALRAKQLDLGLDVDVSAADVAVEACLKAKSLLAELHAENRTMRARNFKYFTGQIGRSRKFPDFDDATLTSLAADLDRTFVERKRDDGSRVFVFPRGHEVWIMIRRGGTLQRQEAKGEDGKPKVGVVRPLEYDVLLYDTETDEIGLNVLTKWQEKLYLSAIGKHLFHNESYFPRQCVLTFQPLIDNGPEALFCQDIPGLEAVKLVEVVRVSKDALSTIDIKRSSDVFGSLNENWRAFFNFGRIMRVAFNIWFQGEKKPRTVTLAAPNVTKYERDSDGMLVLEWMVERGFKSGPSAMRDAAE